LGLFDALRAFLSVPAEAEPPYVPSFVGEERTLTSWTAAFGAGLDDIALGNTAAGEYVTAENALRNIAVQAAIRLLVNDVGSLPVDSFRSTDLGKKPLTPQPWMLTPDPLNPNDTWTDHVKQVVFSILTDGNDFTRAYPSVFDPQRLSVLDPMKVDVISDQGQTIYRCQGIGDLTPNEIIHIPWMRQPGHARGLNPIESAKEGLGVALAADKFVGSYFGNGATLSGVIEFPAGVNVDDTQLKQLKEDFRKKHVGASKSHAVGALTGGAAFKPLPYSNRDAQLLELRASIVEDVARLFGIPPHMLASQEPGASSYASVEQRGIDYVTHAVLPLVRRIEIGYSRLLRGQQTYIRFNLDGLQRGDSQGRSLFYTAMLQNKVMRREEVRAKEDLPYDPEAVGYLETPNNNGPTTTGAAA